MTTKKLPTPEQIDAHYNRYLADVVESELANANNPEWFAPSFSDWVLYNPINN